MPCWFGRLKFALKEKEISLSLIAEARRSELAQSVAIRATRLELAGNFAINQRQR